MNKEPEKMVRDWECSCGHKWAAEIKLSGCTSNISGEATQWCPQCGEKPLCGSPVRLINNPGVEK